MTNHSERLRPLSLEIVECALNCWPKHAFSGYFPAGLREMFSSSTEVPSFKVNFASIEDEDDSVRISSGHHPKMPSRLVNCQLLRRRKSEKRRPEMEGGEENTRRMSVDGSADDAASSSEDDPELDVQSVTEFENAGFGEAGQWVTGEPILVLLSGFLKDGL
jgi:hypothetical protein